ncbi:pyridoxal phosphate-dependent aminotransferase [Verrucomicrobiota bacterium]
MKISEKISTISPSVTLGITSRAKEMARAGEKVCSFAAGEPDFDTPEHIKAGAQKALAAGETKYSPVTGLVELRKAIVEKLSSDNGLNYNIEQIIVSNGAKHSLFNIFVTLCRAGDEVIIPAPYWLSYPEMVSVAGGKSVIVRCRQENDYKLTPDEFESAVTGKTKAVVINSPSNPIGVVYSKDELRALTDVAVKHGIYIVSDEIYEKMIYDGLSHVSVGSFSSDVFDLTITVNGFSKAYAMTGWRLGYFAGPLKFVKAAGALQSHSTSGPNTFAQFGAIEALRDSGNCVKEMADAFEKRRDYIYERLAAIEGITCVKPSGAFYILPNISAFGVDSVSFAERLLEKEKVAVVPGAAFGVDGNVRLSYACSMENIKEGVDRLERFVGAL